VTPDGVLYDKQHILQCLLHQKKDIARKAGAYTRPLFGST